MAAAANLWIFLSSNVLETKLSKNLTETWDQPLSVSVLLSGFGDSNTRPLFWERCWALRKSILKPVVSVDKTVHFRKLPDELQVQLVLSAEADLLGSLVWKLREHTPCTRRKPHIPPALSNSQEDKQAEKQACPIQWKTMASSRRELKAITNCYFRNVVKVLVNLSVNSLYLAPHAHLLWVLTNLKVTCFLRKFIEFI